MHSIEIHFGNSWKEDEAIFSQFRSSNIVNLTNVLDIVNILIDRVNISTRAPREAIFLLLRDIISRTEEIVLRKGGRVDIPFYESPWVITIVFEGKSVFFSFYRAGGNPYVEVKDIEISLSSMIDAVLNAGETLLGDLLEISPQMVADSFVSELLSAIERLKKINIEDATSNCVSLQSSFTVEYCPKQSLKKGFSIGYVFEATSRDFLSSVIPNKSDLYSLMGKGKIDFVFRDRERFSASCYIYFVMEKLVELCRGLLEYIESSRTFEIVSSVENIKMEMKYDGKSGLCAFSIRKEDDNSSVITMRGIDPFVIVDEVLKTSKDFRKRIGELNATQRSNLRFEIFSEEVDTLSSWRKDLESHNLKRGSLAASSLRFEAPSLIEEKESKKENSVFFKAKKLMYVRLWEAEVEGLRLDSTYLCGDRVILTGGKEIFSLERYSGDLLWRKKLEEQDAISFMTGQSGILRFEPGGKLRLIDIESGKTSWETRIIPPFGPPSGIVAGGGRKPRFAILTSGESSIVAVDLCTGEAKWKYRTRRGSRFNFAKFGKFLFVVCGTNTFHCLDVDTGDLLWRYNARYKFMDTPVCWGSNVAVWGREWGEREGRLFVFESLTGEEAWSCLCEGRIAIPPVKAGEIVCIAFYQGLNLIIRGLNSQNAAVVWERNLGNFASIFSWMSIDDRIVMNIIGGVIICLKAEDGTVLWSRNIGGNASSDVPMNLEPILRGGGLFIPADTTYVFSSSDGTLLHKLDDDSPVPDFLRVDENYAIFVGEMSGYFSAYGVSGHIGVVEKRV